MLQVKNKHGFTIIELMFAMTFLAILLVILLVSVIQITRTYNKGLTLKRVNQSGRNIGQEIQQAIQQAGNTSVYNPSKARLCLGDYSFVWSQEGITEGGHTIDPISNVYNDEASTPVGFAKVKDGKLCNSSGPVPKDKSTELLGDGLVIRQPTDLAADNANRLLTFKYTISTPDDGSGIFSFITPNEIHCTGASGDEFCALSTFEVTAYAKGL